MLIKVSLATSSNYVQISEKVRLRITDSISEFKYRGLPPHLHAVFVSEIKETVFLFMERWPGQLPTVLHFIFSRSDMISVYLEDSINPWFHYTGNTP
jgi:hypothetical protein